MIKSFILRFLLKNFDQTLLKISFLRLCIKKFNKENSKQAYLPRLFCIKNSVQKWVKSTYWRKNSISPFFSLIFHLLSHYYKTIRTDFFTLKNCQTTHLKTAYHSSMSRKQKKDKMFFASPEKYEKWSY